MAVFLVCLAGLLGAAVVAVWTRARPGALALFLWLSNGIQQLGRGRAEPRPHAQPLTARGR